MQSNYIPWKGYFDLFAHADVVVLFDSVQSTKNDWRNRNQIKTAAGKRWLTVPTRHSNALRVREVAIADQDWHVRHFRTLSESYARAPYAAELLPVMSGWFARAGDCELLADANRVFLRAICSALGIDTVLVEVTDVLSDEEHDRMGPTERLVDICQRLDASTYLSGPSARRYLETDRFDRAGIALQWFDYDGYPEYPQLHGAYDPAVSILDLLLMTGPQAAHYALRGRTTTGGPA
jgi:hypothetical protein